MNHFYFKIHYIKEEKRYIKEEKSTAAFEFISKSAYSVYDPV